MHNDLKIYEKRNNIFILLLSFGLGSLICQGLNAQSPHLYDFNKPDAVIRLPKQLKEISGLSVHKNSNQLLAVQDEDADIYCIDINTNLIECKRDFGKGGDFEGLELVGEKVYVIKSDGDLYEFDWKDKEELESKKTDTSLKGENDVEGLTYAPESNQLFIACKARPKNVSSLKEAKETKCIYAFDIKDKKLKPDPVFLIALADLRQHINQLPEEYPNRKKLFEFYQRDHLDFSPSAIAIHPQTGNVYITSSKGKQLLVLKPDGKILALYKLDKNLLPQPEGLAFFPDGTLYIASEGKDDCGKILKFVPKS